MNITGIILIAGRGRRLIPFTNKVPKCLLKVNGIEILERQIINLTSHGIKRIIFCIGYKKNMIIKRINELALIYHFEPCFVENNQYLNTNTLYSLYLSMGNILTDYIFLNGDVIFDKEILNLVFGKIYRSITSLVVEIKKPNKEDVKILLDKNNKYVIHIGKSLSLKKSIGEFTGIAYFSMKYSILLQKTLEKLTYKGNKQEYFEYAIEETINNSRSKIEIIDIKKNRFIEIDTFQDYAKAQKKFAI